MRGVLIVAVLLAVLSTARAQPAPAPTPTPVGAPTPTPSGAPRKSPAPGGTSTPSSPSPTSAGGAPKSPAPFPGPAGTAPSSPTSAGAPTPKPAPTRSPASAPAPARDQPLPRAEDKAEADRLFEEGRALLAEGKRAEACERFDLSIRKDPRAVGTMLNLGLCREEVGQLATAVRYYSEARDRAHDQKLTEHEDAASRKIALLGPRVPRLVITLPADLRGDVRVLVDEIVIAREALRSVEVDPGPHTIIVTAPGKLPYETNVEVNESEHRTVAVPALAGAKTVLVREQQSRRALIGKILVLGGVALVGGGIGLGLLGQSNYWDEFPRGAREGMAVMDTTHNCWTTIADGQVVRECNTIGRDATRSASRLANVGVATAITGGIVALAGAALWITAPAAQAVPAVSFSVGPDGGSFAFTRTF